MNKPIENDIDITEFIEGSSILVVIISYRTGELVIDTLKSLTSELTEHPQMRVVVVDNTCGEDTPVIESAISENNWESWVKVKVSPSNGGFSYGNNLAIRAALNAKESPDYVWLLNPDTQIYPGAGTSLAQFLDDHSDVGIAGSCLINDDGTEWGIAFQFPTIFSEMENALQFGPFSRLVKKHIVAQKMGSEPCQVGWLSGASMMIRFDVFTTAGLFDEDYFLYYEETDFCLNAKLSGWSSWYVPSSKVMHISGQSTGATGAGRLSRRLPKYMFESRSHYFSKNHGFLYATVTDLAKIAGLAFNKIIKFVQRKPAEHHPHILRDTLINFTPIKYVRDQFDNKSG